MIQKQGKLLEFMLEKFPARDRERGKYFILNHSTCDGKYRNSAVISGSKEAIDISHSCLLKANCVPGECHNNFIIKQ
ncbi:MAG: hypothetical protein GDA48_09565 [Hormoscilla sp. GM102CHS1]|nr:hypothetical protein [Hormoscilla sp. GM102CHS1]